MTKLTKEQVEAAKQDRSHFAVQTIDSFPAEYWNRFVNGFDLNDTDKYQSESSKALIPFAQKIEGHDFTLNPLEMISIWSRVMEALPREPRNTVYARYNVATILSLAYAAAQINSEQWKGLFAKRVYDSGYVRKLIRSDQQNSIRYTERLGNIGTSLKQIEDYLDYEKKDSELVQRAIKGDKKAMEEFERKMRSRDSLLKEIGENWNNALPTCEYYREI